MNSESSAQRQRSPAVGVPLRRARLAGVLRGSPVSPACFLADFQRATDGDVDELQEAYRKGDLARVRHLAHRMEGAALVIGAGPFAGACHELAVSSSCGAAAYRRELDVFLARRQTLYAWIRARHLVAAN